MSKLISARDLYLATPRTRYSRNIPSKATKKVVEVFSPRKVLDYGAGKGRNSNYLSKHGFDIIAYDPFPTEKKFYTPIETDFNRSIHYNIVLVSFVINVLPKAFREKMVTELKSLNTAAIIIESRSLSEIEKSRKPSWEEFEDGYITGGNYPTFQKGFTLKELLSLDLGTAEIWTKSSGSVATIHYPE